jgi:DnaK suppressor protein
MLVEPETTAVVSAPTESPSVPEARAVRADSIRSALLLRRAELADEHAEALASMETNGVDAGDDVADLGTKALARDQDMVLVSGIRGRMEQVDRALEQLANGRYGRCERCAEEIPVARLAVFPAATQCVRCKRLEERH